MKIGIFSKLGASGGSEFRAAEMANSLARADHETYIFCENKINEKIKAVCIEKVQILEEIFKNNISLLYEMDSILVINTDSYNFSKLEYWEEKKVDLTKIKQLVVLYNFVLDPSKHLSTIKTKCPDVRIITANKHFFNEISTQSRFNEIRHFPRIFLESPIDQNKVSSEKTKSNKIRIGRHSKSISYKFNKETHSLIQRINEKYKDQILWDFLGVDGDNAKELDEIPNIIIRKEFSVSVKEYLQNIDIFLFFIDWGRIEPWSRAVAEGMLSGCPILANNRGGNKDQILHGNNGFLCNSLDEFYGYLCYLIENPDWIKKYGKNSIIYSREFTPDKILKKYLDFIK
jgi:glycosyltransferase involved in cell wall biosynthesis